MASAGTGSPEPATKRLKNRKASNRVDDEPTIVTGLKVITPEDLRRAANKNPDGIRIVNSNLKNSYSVLAAYLRIRDTV